MNANIFRGTGVALVTPFHSDKTIDFTSLEKLVNHVIAGGVNYLVALGTTAESPTLSAQEKLDILHFIIKINNKRLPIVCGMGGNNTNEVIEHFAKYPMSEIDAILSVSPYYNKPSQEGIYQHYKAISDACPVPIILYNVPGRTGSNMLTATVVRLANECKNIIALKEANGNISQNMELINEVPADFLVLSGDDNLAMAQIAIGMQGVISVAANCFTKPFCTVINEALQSNFVAARSAHYTLLKGMDLLFTDGNPPGIKYALYKTGICQNECRLPVVPVSTATANALDAFIAKM